MKWSEVKEIYPNKFVLLTNVNSHIEENVKYIDEVAVIRVLDEDEAAELLTKCKGDTFVYHTAKEELAMEIVQIPTFRGVKK